MSPPKRQSVTRRGFIVAMVATSAAVGALALSAREGNAAPWPAEASVEPLGATAHTANRRADDAAHAAHNSGEYAMLNLITTSNAQGTPTIVLVHGAFADASSWTGVIERLQANGVQVTAPANPLRGISIDSDYLASVFDQIPGPVLAVGHSYGGAVITNAASQASNVVGLVYVAAFAQDEGERLGDVAKTSKDSVLVPALVQRHYPVGPGGKTAVEFVLDPAKLRETFAADLPAEQAALMAATQRPFAEAALSEPSGRPAWKTLPSWAVVATGDKCIGADLVRSMAERAKATITEVDGSHVIMVSQPQAVTDVIMSAVAEVGQAAAAR